uniref:Uncharacterized protein n=1 Tax=Romanomermis culicivorax TaxID=13658 RepID=A0A915I8Z3_ROMCU
MNNIFSEKRKKYVFFTQNAAMAEDNANISTKKLGFGTPHADPKNRSVRFDEKLVDKKWASDRCIFGGLT